MRSSRLRGWQIPQSNNGAITGNLYLFDNTRGIAYTGAKSNACSTCYQWGDFSSAEKTRPT